MNHPEMQLFRLRGTGTAAEGAADPTGKRPPHPGMTPGRPVQVFPVGPARTVDGRKVRSEAEDFRAILSDLATRRDPLRLTVEHGEDPLWGARAAGECSVLAVRPAGLYAEDPAWTEAALAEIRSGARRGISPTFYGTKDAEGYIRPRILRDISLCSVPNLDGMEFVEAAPSRVAAASPAPLQLVKAAAREAHALSADPAERKRIALSGVRGIGLGLGRDELHTLTEQTADAIGCGYAEAVLSLTTEDCR